MKTSVFMSPCHLVLGPLSTKDEATRDKATVFGLTKDVTTKDWSPTVRPTKDEGTKDNS